MSLCPYFCVGLFKIVGEYKRKSKTCHSKTTSQSYFEFICYFGRVLRRGMNEAWQGMRNAMTGGLESED